MNDADSSAIEVDKEAETVRWLSKRSPKPSELTIVFDIPTTLTTREGVFNWSVLSALFGSIATFTFAIVSLLTPLASGPLTEFVKHRLAQNERRNEQAHAKGKSAPIPPREQRSPTPQEPNISSSIPPISPTANEKKPIQQSSDLTQSQAVSLVKKWLSSEEKIFSEPFDIEMLRQIVHTDGPFYAELTSENKQETKLKSLKVAYEFFEASRIVKEYAFLSSRDKPELKVQIYENFTWQDDSGVQGVVKRGSTNYRYDFKKQGDEWKIYQCKKF